MPTKLTTIDTIQLLRLLDIAPRTVCHLAQDVHSGALSLESAYVEAKRRKKLTELSV